MLYLDIFLQKALLLNRKKGIIKYVKIILILHFEQFSKDSKGEENG